MARSARLPIHSSRSFSSSKSRSKWRSILYVLSVAKLTPSRVQQQASSEASGDIRLGARIRWRGKHMTCWRKLDEITIEHESSRIADASRLLHVMSDYDQSAARL